ncbi:MAG: glycerol-3-phosphate acyltransferase [Dehalococcoidales bacterium]|nr:glycerol-3-phosphate acyltransferase [Dehalococcoidales bacterium]
MATQFILFIAIAYLVGALPLSYLAARLVRGIDLRQYGTRQVGTGNLLRVTRSWKSGVIIGAWDFGKGIFVVWLADKAGLGTAGVILAGLAVIIGHNWPVFLRFRGGRGILTATGLLVATPLSDRQGYWVPLTFLAVGVGLLIFFRSTPVPVLSGLAAVPLVGWLTHQQLMLTYGALALFLIVVAKRLVPGQPATEGVRAGELFVNRFFFDRDVKDKKAWLIGAGGERKRQ